MCKEAIVTALKPPLEFASAADFSHHQTPVRQKNKEQMLAERQLLLFSLLPNRTCKSLQHLSVWKTTLAPCPAQLCDKEANEICFIRYLGVQQGSGAIQEDTHEYPKLEKTDIASCFGITLLTLLRACWENVKTASMHL